ncbi:DUF3109 family protein [bacterium]|nr:DUF3109 family protein [bacterium]
MSTSGKKLPLAIENIETATFDCVFPRCGGICCKNGRPPVEPDERERIEKNLERFLPHLRPSARAHVEKHGWLTKRVKRGNPVIAVEGGWCVFANEGCTFQKVGMAEGEPWKYKPSACIRFPLDQAKDGTWYVRQWGHRGEAWDLFCLNPKESPRPASESLRDEASFMKHKASGASRGESP